MFPKRPSLDSGVASRQDMLDKLTADTTSMSLDEKIAFFRDNCDPDDVQQLKSIFSQALGVVFTIGWFIFARRLAAFE